MFKSFKKVAVIPTIIIYLFTVLFSAVPFSYAEDSGEQVFYYLHDHLGGIETVLDEDGDVVERRDYFPFGSERQQIDPQYDPRLDPQSESYGYTGKELDDETGLYYYGARYYDPDIGRFTQIDPLVLDEAQKTDKGIEDVLQDPQMLNGYSYALNNPLKYIDPDGESITLIGLAIAATYVFFHNPLTAFSPDEQIATGIAQGEIKSGPTHIIKDAIMTAAGEKIGSSIINYGFKTINQLRKFRDLTNKGIDPKAAAERAKKILDLTEGQKNNLNRFNSKFSKNTGETDIYDLPQNAKAFQKKVPAKNIPNSKAVYEKQVSPNGETLNYTKTTYDGNGNIVHVKDKINNLTHE